MVGNCFAVETTFDVSGVQRVVSQIIRIGFFPPSIRQVNNGLSANTVPTPTMIAVYLLRACATWLRAVSPVTHFDNPVCTAIFPSIVIAYFITTKGRLV